jgi:ubiquinone/menaquinone biosynthesis C-methylase UbiE/uncharacterized C2H2 Zn-finger protein
MVAVTAGSSPVVLNDGVVLADLVGLLRCPRCEAEVRIEASGLRCDGPQGHDFAIQDGALVMLPDDRAAATIPADHVSNPVGGWVFDWLETFEGWTLNLGAGSSTRRPARCVEVEYSVFANTTVVGDAHHLPFADGAFDAVISLNTFEHLADPSGAARELLRVLRPGGSLRLQTAFLQPLHDEPAHFYNATEFGLRRWFTDFDITDCAVPGNLSPPYALGWPAAVILDGVAAEMDRDDYETVADSRLVDWERYWLGEQPASWAPAIILGRLSQEVQRHACFGFELRAAKPRSGLAVGHPDRSALGTEPGAAMARPSTPVLLNDGVALGELVGLLRCPRCGAEVRMEGSALRCEGPHGHDFGVHDGALVMLPEDRPVATMPADHVSNEVDPEVLEWLDTIEGWTLNLGAGASTRRPARCVELEYSVFANTTVVGDAHRLPFADGVFDAVISFNTFEHLADPSGAAREVLRVLRPGGSLRLQTAFLQPLHEEPAHFYNTTEFGLRRWFADFDITECFVPGSMSPAKMFGWLANHVLYHLEHAQGPQVTHLMSQIKLSQWARFWSDPEARSGFLSVVFDRLPIEDQRRFAAGFELRAVKPLSTEAEDAGPAGPRDAHEHREHEHREHEHHEHEHDVDEHREPCS